MGHHRGGDRYPEIGCVDDEGIEGDPDHRRHNDCKNQAASKLEANSKQKVLTS
jgi:hypothetical protein